MNYQEKTKEELIEALKENEAILSMFIKFSPIYTYIKEVSPSGSRAIAMSDNFSELTGINISDMKGKLMHEIFPAQFAEKMTRDDLSVIEKGEVLHLDEKFNSHSYSTIKFPITQNGKSFLGGYTTDVTEFKHAEAVFQDIIEKNPISIQILDMEGFTLQTNPAHTKLFGANPPADYSVFKDPQLLKQGLGELFERIKQGEVVYFPDSHFNASHIDPLFPDNIVWIRTIGYSLNDGIGMPGKVVLMHEDITARKHAESMFHDIIDKNPMSIQIVDKDGFIVHGNPACAMLFGSVPPPDFSIFDDLQRRYPYLEQSIMLAKSGEVVNLPDLYYNPHDLSPEFPDIPLWIRAIIFPLKDSGGKPERFVLMHENITGRKQAENEIRLLNESLEQRVFERTNQLEAINKALAFHLSEVEQFSYIASHDLQEPLRTLITYSQLVKEEYSGKLDEDGSKYIEFISGSANRMKSLVTGLLNYSLLGKEAVLSEVDCKVIVSDVLADMADSVAKSHAVVSYGELPVVRGYETELRQLFQNLINNAVKFRNVDIRPEIKISVKGRPQDWLFEIEDNGIGIEEKYREKIFTIFKRLHNRNEFEGTGIGLANCKKIVELHGGRIWVEPNPGKGSTFVFTIPRR
jgi:signal transduction histidine kinase